MAESTGNLTSVDQNEKGSEWDKVIVIVGQASGLGWGFLQRYMYSNNDRLLVIGIDKDLCPEFETAPTCHLELLSVDLTNEAAVAELDGYLAQFTIDLVIYTVGIRGTVPSVQARYPDTLGPAETYQVMDLATLQRTFAVNAASVLLFLQKALPYIRGYNNAVPFTDSGVTMSGAKVVIMASRMGSIGHNATGGSYAYRASKAALNAIVKSFSVDVPGVTFLLVHPGRVETGLVAYKEHGAISVTESVGDMLKLIDSCGPERSGQFIDRFGAVIPW